MEEFTKFSDNYSNKILEIEDRLSKLEGNFDETNVEEFQVQLSETIKCPYCGYDFLVEYDETNHEIECPKCDNLIELDWGEFEDDM